MCSQMRIDINCCNSVSLHLVTGLMTSALRYNATKTDKCCVIPTWIINKQHILKIGMCFHRVCKALDPQCVNNAEENRPNVIADPSCIVSRDKHLFRVRVSLQPNYSTFLYGKIVDIHVYDDVVNFVTSPSSQGVCIDKLSSWCFLVSDIAMKTCSP